MAWICRGLIQQRREPPMATSSAPVMVPLWSRNFCRMACRQGWSQQGQDQRGSPAHHTPTHSHLCLVLQGPVWGQQGHDCVLGRDVPLANLREGVEVGQRGDEPQLLLRDSARVDLQVGGRWWLGHTAYPPPPPTAELWHTLASLALTTCWHSAGSGCCSRGSRLALSTRLPRQDSSCPQS